MSDHRQQVVHAGVEGPDAGFQYELLSPRLKGKRCLQLRQLAREGSQGGGADPQDTGSHLYQLPDLGSEVQVEAEALQDVEEGRGATYR